MILAGEFDAGKLDGAEFDGGRFDGGRSDGDGPWSGDVLRRWFDDVRTDLARTWLAHPASLARVGYDGFATSGPGAEPAGYVNLGAGTRDPWEPAELGSDQLIKESNL